MAFMLTDDGTLDTVVKCENCGAELRYNFDTENGPELEDEREQAYSEFVQWAIEDANEQHECASNDDDEPSAPDEDDLTTTDHETFYQYGRPRLRLCLTAESESGDIGRWDFSIDGRTWVTLDWFKSCEQALRAYMERVQFWPNVWFISDHGNAHLIDVTEGK